MKHVIIYTDGACSGNPGPGGWGVLLIYGTYQKSMSGFVNNTTNNQMEMYAVIKALEQLREECEVDLYRDSAYVVNAFTLGWVNKGQTHNWKTSNKEDVKNKELWQELLTLTNQHKISWHKVKGHSDNEYNNTCDKLARAEVDKYLKNMVS